MKLVNPANKRKYTVIVVGTGLAGGAAAASLAELGYNVTVFCYQDSPRRAHSIAAQGGINAAKNYQNDGDSVYRLFYDTVKGGDFRAREANVYRLAEVIGQHHRPVRGPGRAVRPRVRRPARQPLLRRRAGLAHVLRPRPDRPAAPARRLPGPDAADRRRARSRCIPRHEMLDLVVDRRPRARHRRPRPGHRQDRVATPPTRWCWPPAATATSSTSRPTPRAATSPRSGAPTRRAPPSPTPATRRSTRPASRSAATTSRKLTLMSESLRNDGRVWVPEEAGDKRAARPDPRGRARLLPRAQVSRASATSPRATSPRAPPRRSATRAAASAPGGLGVYLDFADAIKRLGEATIAREVRQPVRHVRADHRREPLQGPDAHLPGVALHDGRPVGRLQPDEQRSPACSCSARRTSPTTARTASARAR